MTRLKLCVHSIKQEFFLLFKAIFARIIFLEFSLTLLDFLRERSSIDLLNKNFVVTADNMSRLMRKPVFEVSDQVPHKLSCAATDNG